MCLALFICAVGLEVTKWFVVRSLASKCCVLLKWNKMTDDELSSASADLLFESTPC